MSEFMKLKYPGVLGIIYSEGRVSDTRRVFHAASSASNKPPPSPTRSSDEVGSAGRAGSTAPATTGGGAAASREVAQAADINVAKVSLESLVSRLEDFVTRHIMITS